MLESVRLLSKKREIWTIMDDSCVDAQIERNGPKVVKLSEIELF